MYIAYYVNHPLYTPVGDLQMKIGFSFGLVCQFANFYCHLLLRNLRSPDGNGGYQIPRGFLFNIVTCANYTTEIYQWAGFNIATQTVAGYVFVVVAASIMTNWAIAKHRRLKKVISILVLYMQTIFIFLHNYDDFNFYFVHIMILFLSFFTNKTGKLGLNYVVDPRFRKRKEKNQTQHIFMVRRVASSTHC